MTEKSENERFELDMLISLATLCQCFAHTCIKFDFENFENYAARIEKERIVFVNRFSDIMNSQSPESHNKPST